MSAVVLSSVSIGTGLLNTGGLEGLIIGTTIALFGVVCLDLLDPHHRNETASRASDPRHPPRTLTKHRFASSPGIIRVPALSPSLAQAVLLETGVWMLAAMITAMRHALDYSSTARAISVCVIGMDRARVHSRDRIQRIRGNARLDARKRAAPNRNKCNTRR
jgi:hypothetical protein